MSPRSGSERKKDRILRPPRFTVRALRVDELHESHVAPVDATMPPLQAVVVEDEHRPAPEPSKDPLSREPGCNHTAWKGDGQECDRPSGRVSRGNHGTQTEDNGIAPAKEGDHQRLARG